MPAKNGLTKAQNISVSVREQDFVSVFNDNWDALRQILGIMRPIRKAPGTKLVSSKATVTLENGAVAEGDEIPYSIANVVPVAYGDISIRKYAKAVSIEAVAKYGAEVAIQKTDDAFRVELQNLVLTEFYNFLKTGTLTNIATSFQMALSMAKANILDKFNSMRKTVTDVVAFVNVLDFYEYLGNADITVQTQFGMTYVQNFLGYSTIVLLSAPDIPRNKVIAVPVENIDLYYIDPSDSEFARLGLDYTVQGETNLIGFHAEGDYSRATGATYALMGMTLWAEYIDGISVVTIGSSGGSASTATFTSGAGTTEGTKITVTAPSSVGADMHVFVKAASAAPALPSYLGGVDSTWTELTLDSGVADNVTGFTAGHKMVMAITNGTGQVIYTSAAAGVTVVNKT